MEWPDPDYELFTPSEEMQGLTDTNKERFEEELARPKVEIWPDEWSEWVASHERSRTSIMCHLSGMRASPYCALGHH